MATVIPGQLSWSMDRDEFGYRTYKVIHRVRCEKTEGPYMALNAQGLPTVGEWWSFDDDHDPWAWCRPDARVTPIVEGEPNTQFLVEQTFSSKPLPNCQPTGVIEDPLQIEDRVSGGFRYEKIEAVRRRNQDTLRHPDGPLILSSSLELIKGPQAEFDRSKPTVVIEQNKADIELVILSSLIDHVNDLPLWGFNEDRVKLSRVSWERKYTGLCNIYYTRKLEFDIDEETFTRYLRDEGTKYLKGKWLNGIWTLEATLPGIPPDITVPSDFVQSSDHKGNPVATPLRDGLPPYVTIRRINGTTYLNEAPGEITADYYPRGNFSQLALPDTL